MNKKASTESNTMFAAAELVVGIAIAIGLVALIFSGFQILLGDDVSTQVFTTAVTQSEVLMEELDIRDDGMIKGSYPVQVNTDSYLLVNDERKNQLCLFRFSDNKKVTCHTFSSVESLSIDGGVIPVFDEDSRSEGSVEILDIIISQANDNKFNINYVLQQE